MKLMDKNGRLFGKISVIDVVVVLVVIVMAAALYVKNTSLSHTSIRVTNTPITYQVTAYNVRQYVADAIQEGDLLYDQDYSTAAPWAPSRASRSSPPASSPSCMTARWSTPPPRTA